MLHGLRGRVALGVFVTSMCVYCFVGTLGFLAIANRGRAATHRRVDAVIDQMERGARSGSNPLRIATADGVTVTIGEVGTSPTDNEVVVRRVVTVGSVPVVLVGRASLAGVREGLRPLFIGLWVVVPVAALFTSFIAWYAMHRALRPVASITALAATIDATRASTRVPVAPTNDEIHQLALTVNAMLDRIEVAARVQRQFTSDAAHELRTPLMVAMAEVELARADRRHDAELLDRLDVQLHRLNVRVDDLMLLAVLDEARAPRRVPEQLDAIIGREALALSDEIEVNAAPLVVNCDADLIATAVRNLLTNALRHRRRVVRISIGHDQPSVERPANKRPSKERHDNMVWIHVDDDGDGVPVERRNEVFARFARLDESRRRDGGGSGLGLAIVASIAAAHGGLAMVGDSPLGGAQFSLCLPLGETPSPDPTTDSAP
jgi:signal transduction histidine kinase